AWSCTPSTTARPCDRATTSCHDPIPGPGPRASWCAWRRAVGAGCSETCRLLLDADQVPHLENQAARGRRVIDLDRVPDTTQAEAAQGLRLVLRISDRALQLRHLESLHTNLLFEGLLTSNS